MALPTASDNPFPSLLIVEGTEPAAPAAGRQRVYIDSSSHHLKRTDSSGTDVDLETNQTTAAILGVCHYAAGADAILATISSSTLTDVDATNAKVTFTAPASGNVLVYVDSMVDVNNGAANGYYGLHESSTIVADKELVHASVLSALRHSKMFYVTGIGAGSHTYKLAGAASSNSMRFYTGPTYGHITMVVYSAP